MQTIVPSYHPRSSVAAVHGKPWISLQNWSESFFCAGALAGCLSGFLAHPIVAAQFDAGECWLAMLINSWRQNKAEIRAIGGANITRGVETRLCRELCRNPPVWCLWGEPTR